MKRALATFAALAALGVGQDAPPSWADVVAKACTHKRFGVRLAAAKQLAAAGDVAVPALQAWVDAHGQNALPQLVVDAIADAKTPGIATFAVLDHWARDPSFYWRAQALRGLAERRPASQRALFEAGLDDPAFPYRIEAARGLYLLDSIAAKDRVHALVEGDPDPRVRLRVAAFLLAQGAEMGVPTLRAGLALNREFMGDPWGAREADLARKALRAAYGEAIPDGPQAPLVPKELRDDAGFAVGVAVRSCQYGDLFLRWTAEGAVSEGLFPRPRGTLPESARAAFAAAVAALPEREQTFGDVVCDNLEIAVREPRGRWKAAPGALPVSLADALRALADALRTTEATGLADEISARVPQFATPASK